MHVSSEYMPYKLHVYYFLCMAGETSRVLLAYVIPCINIDSCAIYSTHSCMRMQ